MKLVKLTPSQQRLFDKMSKEENGFTMHGHSNPKVKVNLFTNHREFNVANNMVRLEILKIDKTRALDGNYNDWIISINK